MLRICKDGKRKYESIGISLGPKGDYGEPFIFPWT